MSGGKFVRRTGITLVSGVICFLIALPISIILARVLGPEGKGIYTLASLLPTLIVTFGNLGIGPATVFYVARGDYKRKEILGNNIFLSFFIGAFGIVIGLIIATFYGESIFPNVPASYLHIALCLVPFELFFLYINNILLGAQQIEKYNYIQIIQNVISLVFFAVALLAFKAGVKGAIIAGLLTWVAIDVLLFLLIVKITEGIDIKPKKTYIKQATIYGIQAHIANILGFLNYRIDMFMVNIFLGPAAVGQYTIAVGLVEKLWMISYAASTVLFPRVAAETEEERKNEFTLLVARTVLWTTAFGVLILAVLGRWVIITLFSEAFLPAVNALRALLVGVVTLSVGRVLANDIAGRGFPRFNIYSGIVAVATNIILNMIWIPRYGISGAGWASTVSYTVSFVISLFFHCRLSGNRWTKVFLLQRQDLMLYLDICKRIGHWIVEIGKR